MDAITWEVVLGATLIEFVVRCLWAFVGGVGMMIGFWGNRRLIKTLEDREKSPTVNVPVSLSQTVNVSPSQGFLGGPYIYDPYDRTVWFGTNYGDMRVRFGDADNAIEDISRWLRETGLQRVVSPEATQRVLYRLRHEERIGVSDSLAGELKKGDSEDERDEGQS